MIRNLGVAAAALGATAVMLGAFGAHALRGQLSGDALQIWHTGVDCQFWHALAALAIAGFAPTTPRIWSSGGWIMSIGAIVFSASLYLLALGAPRWVGAFTPCGGMFLIGGWVVVGYAFWCGAANK
jgi:uncharacterized membrane protein YgdD (TMEM256/DUF423 family)